MTDESPDPTPPLIPVEEHIRYQFPTDDISFEKAKAVEGIWEMVAENGALIVDAYDLILDQTSPYLLLGVHGADAADINHRVSMFMALSVPRGVSMFGKIAAEVGTFWIGLPEETKARFIEELGE